MDISLRILESNQEITKRILVALIPQINSYIGQKIKLVKTKLPMVITNAIERSPEYASLMSGQLKYEFGIPDAGSKLAGLINIWSNNIEYTVVPPKLKGSEIIASFSASALRVDFSDVLYTDYAEMRDIERGYSLPWLDWLVTQGNATIIKGYKVQYGPNKASRTGKAIMRGDNSRDKYGDGTSSWSVPSQYSGEIGNNWITRALDSAVPQINQLLREITK